VSGAVEASLITGGLAVLFASIWYLIPLRWRTLEQTEPDHERRDADDRSPA